MQKNLFSLLALVLLLVSSNAHAEIVSLNEAINIAQKHVLTIDQKSRRKSAAPQKPVTLGHPHILSHNGTAALYVFNRQEGGYVIVSAESDTRSQVLGWSDKGSYDPAHVPAPMKDVLDSYVSGIQQLRKASSCERQIMSKALKRAALATSNLRQKEDYHEVGPLLADIEWGQHDPFNRMVPTYNRNNVEDHCPTGCVATAIAQIMRYHQWPEQGHGSYSYVWEGQTLSADFEHAYRWDLMLPRYETNEKGEPNFTEEQAQAVSQLMYDVGVSMDMNYSPSGSGSVFYEPRMVKFFDYDKNMQYLHGDYCSTEDWENVLRSEVNAGRPVFCAGGAHAFVCDGYNSEGLFHYNYGWGGSNNGWFASTATGFDSSPSIDYGIEKNHGGKGALSLISTMDFIWKDDNNLEGRLELFCSGLDGTNKDVTIENALALENVQTGEVSYYSKQSFASAVFVLSSVSLNVEVPDGTYHVYPVGRLAGEKWQTFYHNPLCQITVDLTVSGGVKTWANNNILNPIDEGVVLLDGIYYILDESKGEATVTRRNERGNCYSGDIVIPDNIEYQGRKYIVSEIGKCAFEDCSGLTSVTIPNSVTSIGEKAFKDCIGLTSATIGNSVTSIGEDAFYGCSGLTSVIIPNSVMGIGGYAFYDCSGLTSVIIPNSVMGIGRYAFSGCGGLISIIVESENNHYDSRENCNALIETATNTLIRGCMNTIIPNSVTSIGEAAFSNCSGLTSIEISNSVTSIGENAFYGCSGLTSVTIPNSVTSIGDYAFDRCSGLTSIEIPNSVTNIVEGTFYECSSLTSVTIPNSVTSIGRHAFADCFGLKSIEIPNSVISIGDYAFDCCIALTSVTIPNSVPSIGYAAFRGCSGLTSVTIPNSVTRIGDMAFAYCSGLTSIAIPNSVTSIGEEAFHGCSGLTSIVVDKDNKVYDSRDNCNALIKTATNTLIQGSNTAIIPNSVTSIGSSAFLQCYYLTSITIPNSVTSIGSGAFYFCSGLTSITIGNSVTSIGDNTFYNCSLTSIEIPNSVTSIGNNAFDWCSVLTSVTIPNNVTSIGDRAFDHCYRLKSVTNFATTPQVISDGTFFTYGTLHVLKGYKDVYAAADVWKNFTIVDDVDPALGIEEIGLTPAFSTREEATYNLQGVKVNDVKQGNIYVRNGRKFIAK